MHDVRQLRGWPENSLMGRICCSDNSYGGGTLSLDEGAIGGASIELSSRYTHSINMIY
jgi:hypothetical protein